MSLTVEHITTWYVLRAIEQNMTKKCIHLKTMKEIFHDRHRHVAYALTVTEVADDIADKNYTRTRTTHAYASRRCDFHCFLFVIVVQITYTRLFFDDMWIRSIFCSFISIKLLWYLVVYSYFVRYSSNFHPHIYTRIRFITGSYEYLEYHFLYFNVSILFQPPLDWLRSIVSVGIIQSGLYMGLWTITARTILNL